MNDLRERIILILKTGVVCVLIYSLCSAYDDLEKNDPNFIYYETELQC